MKRFKALTSAIVLGMLAAGTAQAQDFSGAYKGLYFRDNPSGPTGVDVSIGAFVGMNFDLGGNLVAGVEGELDFDWNAVWGMNVVTGVVSGRIGFDMGDTLVYGKIGSGYSSVGTTIWHVGAGADYRYNDRFILRGEFDRVDPAAPGLATQTNLKAGILVQF